MNAVKQLSSPQPRRDYAKSLLSSPRKHAGLALSAALITILAACGGGGGGDPVTQPPATQPPVTQPPVTQPPVNQPPPTASGVVNSTENCQIPGEAAACEGRAQITLVNVTSPTLTIGEGAGATTIPLSGAGGAVTFPLLGPPGERKLVLKAADGTVLDSSKTVASACVPGSAWDTELGEGRCTQKLCYDEAVMALSGSDATPHNITLAGRERVKNMTGISDNWEATGYRQRYFNCGVGGVDAFGRWQFVCNEQNGDFNDPAAYNWRFFYLNPVTGTFHRGKAGSSPANGLAPAGFVFSEDRLPTAPIGWGNTAYSARNGGWFYTYAGGVAGSQFDLWFLKDGRPEAERQLVFAGTTGPQGTGGFRLLRTVKNSCSPN